MILGLPPNNVHEPVELFLSPVPRHDQRRLYRLPPFYCVLFNTWVFYVPPSTQSSLVYI